MFFKVYLTIIAIVLVTFSLNCSAQLDDSSSDVFYSAEEGTIPKATNIPKILESSDSENDEWYSAEAFEKRSPTGEEIVRL
uniref:Secreted protein n=1 Tax=Strongyloides papillosus TaxID=174720 RepID=A0A0N5CA62_STREA